MKTLLQPTKDKISEAFRLAEQDKSKLREFDRDLYGFTGKRIKHVINNLCGMKEKLVYLELGVYRGSTLVAANYENTISCYAIDDYTIDNKEGRPYNEKGWDNPRLMTIDLIDRYQDRENVKNHITLIDGEATSIDLDKIKRKIDIVHYDLDEHHADLSTIIQYYKPVLDTNFILLISNWNSDGVRNSYNRLCETNGFEIELLEEKLSSYSGDKDNWFNGVSVSVVKVVHND